MGRTQKVIADTVSKELDIPRRLGRRFLQMVLDLIADDLVYTGRVELRGLGVFFLTNRPAQKVIHPGTGKPILVPKKKVAEFRTSAAIRRRLNPPKKTHAASRRKSRTS